MGRSGRGDGAGPTTASMHVYGEPAGPGGHGTHAGLVLLYAPSFETFAPAYLLSGGDLSIGRDPASGICVPEAAVSRQHARVRFLEGRWVLQDLGGRNGTLVDGAFVHEVTLEHLHEIRVGDAIFKFVEAGAESYARYRIDGELVGASADEARASRARRAALVGGYQVDQLARALERVAKSDISVIVLGESGTGKEVCARELHAWSGRRGAFQALNCASIPATLLESELFGYKRGAFSGADRDKPGLIRSADGGTLFLDEIGDMPIEAQAKLLRVLQAREVVPLGATQAERVDVRFVCATHRDLTKLQLEGKFRGDLFARLNEYTVRLPPLRERKEDLYALARALLARHGRPDLGLSFAYMTGLSHYDWPFNVRELEAFLKRAIALCDDAELSTQHFPDEIRAAMEPYARRDLPPEGRPTQPATAVRLDLAGAAAPPPAAAPVASPATRAAVPSEAEVRAMLRHCGGNIAAVSRAFGKERMQIHRWLKRYAIDPDDYR